MLMISTRLSLRNVLILALFCIAVTHAHAARLALVIGNDQYQAVEKLRNARNDANLIAGVLRNAGFEVTLSGDLGREGLWSTIDAFKARLGKGDEVVFYFAGHGVQIGSTQLLLPTDIKPQSESQVQRDGVPLVDIQDALKNARVAVFIIDACRDNPFPKVGTRSLGATRGLLPPEPTTGQIIMLSAGRNQKALDEVPGQRSNNGLFTWELAQVLQTPGIEIRAALEQVKEAVDDKARRARHQQRPSVVNDLRGNFYFLAPGANTTPQTAQAPTVRTQTDAEAEQELWNSIKDSGSVDALNAYLQEFPRGRFVAQARVLLAKLKAAPGTTTAAPAPPAQTTAAPAPPAIISAPQPGSTFKDCASCPEMVIIGGGSFTMGSGDGDADETPQRRVTVGQFAIGKLEVTRGQWAMLMGTVPSAMLQCGDDCPVDNVSWDDAQDFVQKLNALTGQRYRLPTEAEWEFAARAGGPGRYAYGDIDTALGEYSWYSANSQGRLQRSGQKKPNAWGVHDMHGNAHEWVQDCWHDNYRSAPIDGSAWVAQCSSSQRVLRGGSWSNGPAEVRSAYRFRDLPDIRMEGYGFRLAKSL